MIPIQGSDAILSILKDTYVPFICASDITVNVDTTEIATRTVTDGNWAKSDYQTLGFTVTLGGVIVFDADNFDSWQLLINQLGTLPVQFRISFTDENGTSKSMQGTAIVKSSAIQSTPGNVVKGTFSLLGSGQLFTFDGLIPCATMIDSITVNGQEGDSGIVTVDYTYTGDLYQILYQIDGTGTWFTALGAVELSIPGLSVENHSIQLIPVCTNGFQGTGLSQAFKVTQALTCDTVISDITIDLTTMTAVAVYSGGSATQMRYSVDAFADQIVPIGSVVTFPGLFIGSHSITMTPVCTVLGNQVDGTGFTKSFTISSSPTNAVLNYNFICASPFVTGPVFSIYVNGVLAVIANGAATGSINVPVGAIIRCAVSGVATAFSGTIEGGLEVIDSTTSTTLTNQSQNQHNINLGYSFTTSPHTYSITQSITP